MNAGMFDHLIPKKGAAPPPAAPVDTEGVGMFSHLVPRGGSASMPGPLAGAIGGSYDPPGHAPPEGAADPIDPFGNVGGVLVRPVAPAAPAGNPNVRPAVPDYVLQGLRQTINDASKKIQRVDDAARNGFDAGTIDYSKEKARKAQAVRLLQGLTSPNASPDAMRAALKAAGVTVPRPIIINPPGVSTPRPPVMKVRQARPGEMVHQDPNEVLARDIAARVASVPALGGSAPALPRVLAPANPAVQAESLRSLPFDPVRFLSAVITKRPTVETHQRDAGNVALIANSNNPLLTFGPDVAGKVASARENTFARIPTLEAARRVASALGLDPKVAANLLNPKSAAFKALRAAVRVGGGVSNRADDVAATSFAAGANRTDASIGIRHPDIETSTDPGMYGKSTQAILAPFGELRHILSGDIRTEDEIPAAEHIADATGDFLAFMTIGGAAEKAASKIASVLGKGAAEAVVKGTASAAVKDAATSAGLKRLAIEGARRAPGRAAAFVGENIALQAAPVYGRASDMTAQNGKPFLENFGTAAQEAGEGFAKMFDPRTAFDPNATPYERGQAALAAALFIYGSASKASPRVRESLRKTYGWAVDQANAARGFHPELVQAIIRAGAAEGTVKGQPYAPTKTPTPEPAAPPKPESPARLPIVTNDAGLPSGLSRRGLPLFAYGSRPKPEGGARIVGEAPAAPRPLLMADGSPIFRNAEDRARLDAMTEEHGPEEGLRRYLDDRTAPARRLSLVTGDEMTRTEHEALTRRLDRTKQDRAALDELPTVPEDARNRFVRSFDPERLDPFHDDPASDAEVSAAHVLLFGEAPPRDPLGEVTTAARERIREEVETDRESDYGHYQKAQETAFPDDAGDWGEMLYASGAKRRPKPRNEIPAGPDEKRGRAPSTPDDIIAARRNPQTGGWRYTNNAVQFVRMDGTTPAIARELVNYALTQETDHSFIRRGEIQKYRRQGVKPDYLKLSEMIEKEVPRGAWNEPDFDGWHRISLPKKLVADYVKAKVGAMKYAREDLAARHPDLTPQELDNLYEYYARRDVAQDGDGGRDGTATSTGGANGGASGDVGDNPRRGESPRDPQRQRLDAELGDLTARLSRARVVQDARPSLVRPGDVPARDVSLLAPDGRPLEQPKPKPQGKRDAAPARVEAPVSARSSTAPEVAPKIEVPPSARLATPAESAKPSAAAYRSSARTPLDRQFRAGQNVGTVRFASELQRDLYDLGALDNKARTTRDFGPSDRTRADALRSALADHLGGTVAEASTLAAKVRADVLDQAKGIGDGETRAIRDTATGSTPTSQAKPAPADVSRTEAVPKGATTAAKPLKLSPVEEFLNTTSAGKPASPRTDEPAPVAARNADRDPAREARGAAPVEMQATQPKGAAAEAARSTLGADPEAGNRLAAEIAKRPRVASGEEQALLDASYARDAAREKSLLAKLNDPLTSAAEVPAIDAEYRAVRDALDLNDEATRKSGREWAVAGRARQAARVSLADPTGAVQLLTAAKGGKRATREVEARVRSLSGGLAKVEADLSAAQDKAAAAAARKVFAEEAAEARRAARAGDREALKAELADLSAQWSKAVVKLTANSGVPTQAPELAAILGKMARNVIRQGALTLEEVVAGVRAALPADVRARVSDRDIHDALSGYGRPSPQGTPTAEAARLSELKRVARLLSQIDDVTNGDPLPSRPTPSVSDQVRELGRVLAEVKKSQGIGRKTEAEIVASIEARIKEVQAGVRPASAPRAPGSPAVEAARGQYREALRVQKLSAEIAELEARVASGDPTPPTAPPKAPPASKSKEVTDLEARRDRVRVDLENLINSQKPMTAGDWVSRIQHFNIFSGPGIFAKLTGATLARIPAELSTELVAALARPLPAGEGKTLGQVANKEGAFVPAAYLRGVVDLLNIPATGKDMWQKLTTGANSLDAAAIARGQKHAHRHNAFWDVFSSLHGAVKTPLQRLEYRRGLEQRTAAKIRQGVDVHDPGVQLELVSGAYNDSLDAILRGDNRYVDTLNGVFKAFGKGEALARTLVPVTKVATNYIGQAAQYTGLGLIEGLARHAHALVTEGKVSPETADTIIRAYRRGGVGAGLAALVMLTDVVQGPGWYTPGSKKDDEEHYGDLQIGTLHVPHSFAHNPVFEGLSFWLTIKHAIKDAMTEKTKEGDVKRDTLGAAGAVAFRASVGVASQLPGLDTIIDAGKGATGESAAGKFVGGYVKGVAIPQGAQALARGAIPGQGVSGYRGDVDEKGEPIKRKTTGFIDTLEEGVPVLRERLPLADPEGDDASKVQDLWKQAGGKGRGPLADERRAYNEAKKDGDPKEIAEALRDLQAAAAVIRKEAEDELKKNPGRDPAEVLADYFGVDGP